MNDLVLLTGVGGGGGGATNPSAPTNSVQFNNAGSFGGDASLLFTPDTSLTLQQTTAATNVANQNSPSSIIGGTVWNGTASANDQWTIKDVVGSGTNGASTLTLTQSGSTGAAAVQIPHQLSIAGTTSGATTLVAPAVAGTNTNALSISNSITLPTNSQYLGQGGGAASPTFASSGNPNTGVQIGSTGEFFSIAAAYVFSITNNPVVTAGFNSTGVLGWTSGTGSNVPGVGTVDTALSRLAAGVLAVGSGTSGNTSATVIANGHGVLLKSTAAITGPVPVKADTANANQVVVTTTTDTGAGVPIGVCINSPGVGANAFVVTSGIVAMTLGTGTASIGQFVIVDTTTNGRVQCTSTYTAGTVIGVAMSAQSSVGSTFNVLVGLR